MTRSVLKEVVCHTHFGIFFYLSTKIIMWKLLLVFSCIITSVVGAPDRVTGHRGETVHINCSYKSGYETNKKYLCMGECRIVSKNIIVESGSSAKDDRFSLIDNNSAGVFTVTITDLRTEDEGTYWCGVSGVIYDDYAEVLLLVKHDEKISETSTVRPSLVTTSSISTSQLNLQSTSKPAKTKPLSSTVSVLFICMGLIIMVVVLLVALMMLRKQKKGSKKSPKTITQSRPSVSSVNIVPDDTAEDVNFHDHEYQEIRELQPMNAHATISIYSTVNGPADSVIYSTPKTPTAIYSVAEAPTH